jgi:hypothetical protein
MPRERAVCQSNDWCPCCGQLLSSPRRSFEVIRAQRFELVDVKERPWATLGFDQHGEVQFNLLNRDGRGEMIFAFSEEQPEMWMFCEGNARMRLAVVHGNVQLSLSDELDHDRLRLRVDRGGTTHIETRNGQDEWTDLLAERGA